MQAVTWARKNHSSTLGLLLLPVVLLLVLTWSLIGSFFYTLDDAYIHLQLAEMIGQSGHFGLHPSAVSSPSSSLLWTLWLAAWSWLPIGYELVPLITNIGILALLIIDLQRWLDHRLSQTTLSVWLVVTILISLNVYWLALSGMEQLTQAWLAARVMMTASQQEWGSRSLYWAVFALALIRYESLALCLPILVLAAYKGEPKKALATLLMILMTLGAYSWYLHEGLALGWLPASVQIKSVFADLPERSLTALAAAMLRNFQIVMQYEYNRYLLWLAIGWLFTGRNTLGRQLMVIATLVYVAHAFMGRVDSGRYEMYVLACCWIATLHNTLPAIEQHLNTIARRSIFLMLVIVLNLDSFFSGLSAPWAAKNIHDQQGQLAVLVQRYLKQPVAVNDVGLISRGNELPVLDLVGLGSKGVYELRIASGPGPEWVSLLLAQHKTQFAIIYEHWFPDWPKHLIKVATYEIPGPLLTPAGRQVSLFADSSSSARVLEQAITRYQADHPTQSAWFNVLEAKTP